MTPLACVSALVFMGGFAAIAKGMQNTLTGWRCLKCGGRAGHKPDCPWQR